MKHWLEIERALPVDAGGAELVGRVWSAELEGPVVVRVHDGDVYDLSPVAADVQSAPESRRSAGRNPRRRPPAPARHGRRNAWEFRRLGRGHSTLSVALVSPIAGAVRFAGDQGQRGHVRGEPARAGDRGAGTRRRREGRGPSHVDRRRSSADNLSERPPRIGRSAPRQGRADRAGCVVAVPRGRHRP